MMYKTTLSSKLNETLFTFFFFLSTVVFQTCLKPSTFGYTRKFLSYFVAANIHNQPLVRQNIYVVIKPCLCWKIGMMLKSQETQIYQFNLRFRRSPFDDD